MSKKDRRTITLYTKMLKRRVRMLLAMGVGPHAGKAGVIVNVYLIPSGLHYTVMLKDGRLLECTGQDIVVER